MAMPPRSQVPALALLGDRNFLAYWVAGTLNSASRFLELLTLSLYVLDATDSAFQLGLIWVFSFIPRTIFSPFTGVIADRFSRKRILQVSQVLNVLFAAGLLGLFRGRPDSAVARLCSGFSARSYQVSRGYLASSGPL